MESIIFGTIVTVLSVSIVISIVSNKKVKKENNDIDDFLLGNRSLDKVSIINLLLSSSFGVNAIFYAAWLGYTLGGWAIVIQAFWAFSFIWLSKYSISFNGIDSLHDFLGKNFGKKTKLIASYCSIIGIMVFVGWETGISEGAFNSIIDPLNNSGKVPLITLSIFVGTLLYTILGGIRGNAYVNTGLNAIKILIILVFIFLMYFSFLNVEGNGLNLVEFFPPIDETISNFGLWGLVTNVAFNITWQFVDNSSWQSIISGKSSNTKWNLKGSGIYVFLSIGLFGSILGALLMGTNGVTPDNILFEAVGLSSDNSNFTTILLIFLLVASVISLLDGMFLAIGLTISKDLGRTKSLTKIKFLLLPIGLISIYGTKLIQNLFGLDLFDLVYIVVISQLSLFGPVFIGLKYESKAHRMWIAIVGAILIGLISIWLTWLTGNQFYLQGAGTFTLLSSLFFAFLLKKK